MFTPLGATVRACDIWWVGRFLTAKLRRENDKADPCPINTKPDLIVFICKAKDKSSRLDDIRHETRNIGNLCAAVPDHTRLGHWLQWVVSRCRQSRLKEFREECPLASG